MPNQKQDGQLSGQPERELPLGVKLLLTLEGHEGLVYSVAFDSVGRILASASGDQTLKLWDVASGELLRTLEGHNDHVMSVALDPLGQTLASGSVDHTVRLWDVATGKLLHILERSKGFVKSVAFDPAGRILASGGGDRMVKLWDVSSGELLRTLEGHKRYVSGIAFDSVGRILASASGDQTLKLWDVSSGELLRTLEGHNDHVMSVAFDPAGRILASGSDDQTVKLWDVATGKLLRTLEGHTRRVNAVTFSMDGQLLASESSDGTLRLWSCETWETVAIIPEPPESNLWRLGLAFHPTSPLLVTSGSKPDAPEGERYRLIHFWELDLNVLLGKEPDVRPAMKAVHHTTAKIVLVGDHSVGKSALGWHLAYGEFKEQAATHGQQFWVLPQLGKLREDGTECEAILWDLAGQPDYRLIHTLFLDDVDLALILFDASDISDPLHGVEFWLEQLKAGRLAPRSEANQGHSACLKILVGARSDRGAPALTVEELEAFCRQRGISGYLGTSAKAGWGLAELIRRMKELIVWEDKPATVTTVTFKRIKDYVLKLKENLQDQRMVASLPELREPLERTDATWEFTDEEIMTAVGHLENYGYVKRLRTSKGEERILLAPEILNNLASSFVLEARHNPKGLGSLEEKRLLAGEYQFHEGEYQFRELKKLSKEERDVLLDSA
ncbi:MAG TPA: hypothetical protein VJ715_00500, partial [Pyrinomonadaceae bacterium]|nr:hypothetical protein [Pyrinomonadaceae bacterium]